MEAWYVRDAQGNVMAVYEKVAWGIAEGQAKLTEHHVYGSSRLGIIKRDQDIDQPKETAVNIDLLGPTYLSNFKRGNKFFELSNHLGNVLVTVSDKHSGVDTSSDGEYDYYQADVVSASDYYPFGMQMVGRTLETSKYRYGFNRQEKSDELTGSGNSYTAEFWQYDARIGRRWNVDPVKKFNEGGYTAFGNNPIFIIDPNGADTIRVDAKGKIASILSAKGNHVLFDHNKQQIQFNDPETDTKLLNKKGIKVGDQLLYYLSEKDAKAKVDGQGKILSRILAKQLGTNNPAGYYLYVKSLKELKEKSYDDWDFSHSVLGPMVNADINSNLGKETRSRGRTYTDDYRYEQYYFFVFGDKKTTYNLADAGNFMWGAAGQRSGFTWLELKAGSNLNELRQLRGLDTEADQRAIKAGYEFGK